MPKSNITISIDQDLKEYFSAQTINLSGLLNDFLRNYKDKDQNTISDLNYQIKRKEFDILLKDHAKISAKLKSLQLDLDQFEKDRETKEVQNLKLKKERQERLLKCQNCYSDITGPVEIKDKEYILCISCLNAKYGTEDLTRFLK